MSKLQVATLSNLQEFLKLHNVQIDGKISEAVKTAIRTVSQSDDGYTLYFYTKDAPVTVDEAAFTIAIPQPTAKADKVANAVKGHLAGLDENGNLVDSGKAITDFDESGAASTAKTEVLTYVGTIPADAKAKDVVNYIKEAVTAGKGRMDTAEGKITAVEKDLATEKPKIAKNTSDITALKGLVGDGYEAIPSASIKGLFSA